MAGLRRRIVLCDDSRTYATALVRTLEHDGALDVVGVFPTAEKTLAALPALRPDLVTMDLELPGMSGLDAVEEIMASAPTPVVVLSDYTPRNSSTAHAALRAGAVAAIPKGDVDLTDPASLAAATLRRRVSRLSEATVVRHPLARLRRPEEHAAGRRRTVAAIGICASTGGPKALVELLATLPASFPIPILVVQHIAPSFEASLVRTLARAIELPIGFAADGMRLRPGVWLAPQGSHLRVRTHDRLELLVPSADDAHRHCPAGDVLLESLAHVYGAAAAGVVLTGMGSDGAAGIAQVRAAGGLVAAQDESSSTVYGMPRAARERGVELALAPTELGRLVARLQPLGDGYETGMGAPPPEGRPQLRLVR